jgi:hypothetical protein
MFLRFVISGLDEESHQEPGVFHAAGNLRDSGLLSQHDEKLLQEIRDWFSDSLEKPARLRTPKRLTTGSERMGFRGSKLQQKTISARYARLLPYLRVTMFLPG